MIDERKLRLKWTLRAHGKQVVFAKGRIESPEHVLMKAFLWALYLPQYPDLRVEVFIGDRYKPDVVQLNPEGVPVFWGESGQVGLAKYQRLLKRYKDTHFAFAKWEMRLEPFAEIIEKATQGIKRTAPVDLIQFRDGDAERFINDDGEIQITHNNVTWQRIE